MSIDNNHDSLWTTASQDVTAEVAERAAAMSLVAVASVVPFLFGASSLPEFEQRLALQADVLAGLLESVSDDPRVHTSALAEVRSDFLVLQRGRVQARLEKAAQAVSKKTAAQHSDGSGAFVVQVTGTGENTWSQNGLSFDTAEEAKAYASDLMGRWMGADMARVVPTSTPRQAPVEPGDPSIVINYRTGSKRKTASIALTSVGIVDRAGLVCKGKDPSGKDVRFKVTKSEMDQLASILFGDLSINFSGVSVDQKDIINDKEGSLRRSASRPISEIADDIQTAWGKVNYGAVPYLDAMKSLNSINDRFYEDDARSVVLYFLSNASSFRGEQAKALKAELKALLSNKAAAKTASTYCPNHGVYVGAGNQEQHDHCKTEQRKSKESAHGETLKTAKPRVHCNSCGSDFADTTSLGAERCKSCGSSDLKAAEPWKPKQSSVSLSCHRIAVATTARPLYEIAEEIRRVWRPVNYGAKPYLDALDCLNSIDDSYGMDGAKSVIAYFLSNATTWRGEDARRIKKELKKIMDSGGSWGGGSQASLQALATDDETLNQIMRRDPNGQSQEPTPASHKAHQDWAVSTFGQQAWDRYKDGTGWGHQPGDESEHIEYHGSAKGLIGNDNAEDPKWEPEDKCWDCGGSGSVPAQGHEDADDVDNGQVKCPTCDGSGTLSKTGRRLPFLGSHGMDRTEISSLLPKSAAMSKAKVKAWLLDYAWMEDKDHQAREVDCIMSQDGWKYIDGVADQFAGASESGGGPQEFDEGVGFALSALYECHDKPHLPTCPYYKADDNEDPYKTGAFSDITAADIAEIDGSLDGTLGFGGMPHPFRHQDSPETKDIKGLGDMIMEDTQHIRDENETEKAKVKVPQTAASFKVATVSCRKCTAGATPDGDDCGYCDGMGSLDPTTAMIKAADGWEQGITAEAFTEGNAQEIGDGGWKLPTGDGAERYNTPALDVLLTGKPEWVHDAWDEGKATQEELDTGRANGVGHVAVRKEADVAALRARLLRLSGKPVHITYTSDWGVSNAAGILTVADGNAMVTSASGAVVSVPDHNVLSAEATGYSDYDLGEGMNDRKPSVMELLLSGTPSGSTGSRRTANPYSSNSNPYSSDGPGSPDFGEDAAMEIDPKTTRPRVQPNDNLHSQPNFNPELTPHNPGVSPRRTGPVDRNADTIVMPNKDRAKAATAAHRQYTQAPALTPRQAKVAQIAAGVGASNPGMSAHNCYQVAEATLRRFSGVVHR